MQHTTNFYYWRSRASLHRLLDKQSNIRLWNEIYANQGCGAGNQISGSTSRMIWSIKNHCIICTIGFLHKLCLFNGTQIKLQLHH